ncbi:MAG: OmpA family protein [Desulfobulbaceae bacterium]|nr:OmpA family protein [Desulfobulbaceae bacterium]
MRNYIFGISLFLFTLSAVLTFKALVIVSHKRESGKELSQPKPSLSRSTSTSRSRLSSREPDSQQDIQPAESVHSLSGKSEPLDASRPNINESSPLELAKPTVVSPETGVEPPASSMAVQPQSDSAPPLETDTDEKGLVLGILGGFSPTTDGPAKDSELNETVSELVPLVLSSQGNKLIIEGHTDKFPVVSSETDALETARIISRNWAQSVGDLFIKNGVPAQQITVIGYGYAKPVTSNDTAEERMKNRRVVIKLIIAE